jgi:hypothetical protein
VCEVDIGVGLSRKKEGWGGVTTGGCESTSVALLPTQWTLIALHVLEVCKQCTSAIMSTATNNVDQGMATSKQESARLL